MHPGPVNPVVLMRQHEHRSGLIWSGDHETSITDLQCVLHQFSSDQQILDPCNTRFDLHQIQLRGKDNTYWGMQHAKRDEYIRWYQKITRVYIGNPTNRDTRTVGYQPTGVASFAKKVQTIIRRCSVSIDGTLGCTPSQHNIQKTFSVQPSRCRPREPVLYHGTRGVKRGARRLLGHGACDGRQPVPPFPGRHGHADPGHEVERDKGSGGRGHSLQSGSGTLRTPPSPGLGFALFHSPHPTSLGVSSFRAPPPPGIAGSSAPHQPISYASSSDEDERTDDTTHVHQLGFGHRVGKKTMRDAYGPFFTGAVRKSWTLPINRIVSHNELVRKLLKYRDMNPNLWIVRITVRVSSYYEMHRMFYINLYSMNNDEEIYYLWTISPHYAKEVIHILVEFEKIQQHSIPITHDINITNMTEHITVVIQMVSDEPSMSYPTVNNDDDEIDQSDGDDAVSS
ncbi:hypothetical protein M9H77_07777 [Catharanthus roseus]|uniref:Uncharacterized protein n=1 Tax=Catharanthus roseus TaxID=4058 RepID=A0ACC0BW53_CATRO|nr:hypothetical protein M9H77_07777 [Catharanthus roseus]